MPPPPKTNGKSPLPSGDGEDDLEKLLKAGNLDAMIPKDLSGKDKIVHADDALDFESEDELAEDEEDASPRAAPTGDDDDGLADIFGEEDQAGDDAEDGANNGATDQGAADQGAADQGAADQGAADQSTADGDLEDALRGDMLVSAEAQQMLEQEEQRAELRQLQEWYPGFEEHTVLRMNQMFAPEPSQTQLPQPKNVRPLNVSRLRVEMAPDASSLFVSEQDPSLEAEERVPALHEISPDEVHRFETELGRRSETGPKRSAQTPTDSLEALQLEVSNWDDVLDMGDDDAGPPPAPPVNNIGDIHIYGDELYSSDEENSILEGRPLTKRTKLDLNDAALMFVEDRRQRADHSETRPEPSEAMNISNDRAYDMLRANYQRKVRSTIGSLNIDHTMPAVRLQSPFYKVRHSKAQLRAGHRQKLGVKPGTVMEFTPLKNRKRWKDKNRQTQELFAKSSDLTLGDSGSVFLIEYSEEIPLVLSGFGMGSKLINYYRKANANDMHRPKRAVGETHVLEEQDKSTFWNFGFVEPGNVVPTLYNQMTRSPVFQHESQQTDFLLVKSTNRTRGTRYYLRSMPYLFVSGQLFPAVQIPGPHSRKVTAASKNRLRMVVYRVLNRSPHQRLQIRDVANIFPDYNEVQNRQRLKEFMEYQRSGEDQGFWKVKPGDHVPNEAEIRSLITPEDIMLLESMRTGQQRLEDSEYSKVDDDDRHEAAATGTNDEALSLDEQLAPWNLSKNFINAIQGKAMLSLHGEGDPTGRGEGYSFLRTSMKGGFLMESSAEDVKKLGGHSYNVAMQQRAYDEEIKRIWNAQRASLSVTDPQQMPDASKLPKKNAFLPGSKGESDKVLQITRMVRDENDVMVRRTELVTDPLVIHAYLRRRKAAEEERMAVDQIAVTDDVEANKQSRKFLEQELARLNRNADRRHARKATKQDPKMKATTRKCATCGAVGHIKTNKSCPMYNDIYLNAAAGKGQKAT